MSAGTGSDTPSLPQLCPFARIWTRESPDDLRIQCAVITTSLRRLRICGQSSTPRPAICISSGVRPLISIRRGIPDVGVKYFIAKLLTASAGSSPSRKKLLASRFTPSAGEFTAFNSWIIVSVLWKECPTCGLTAIFYTPSFGQLT